VHDWRWIPGWEGFYQAHPSGQIRSVDRKIVDANGKRTRLKKGMILRPQMNGNGFHHHVGLAHGGVTTIYYVHDLVALTFIGQKPPASETRHLNCNHIDNRAENLAYGTRRQNRRDSMRVGVIAQGERHGNSKLTADQVRQIRQEHGSGHIVAKKYGVTRRTIDRIRSGEAWKGQPEIEGRA